MDEDENEKKPKQTKIIKPMDMFGVDWGVAAKVESEESEESEEEEMEAEVKVDVWNEKKNAKTEF
jgi:hypothetical protein